MIELPISQAVLTPTCTGHTRMFVTLRFVRFARRDYAIYMWAAVSLN